MAVALLAALLLLAQGMGSGTRTHPGVKPIRELHPPAIDFRDIAAAAGLSFRNSYGGEKTKRYILEMTGNGVGVVDYNNDGRPDLVFPDGKAPALYRNEGSGKFAAVPGAFRAREWGQGVCAGDYDNDGWTDLLMTYYGGNVLYRNRNGAFIDVTAESGLAVSGSQFSTGCAFLDYDRDGKLDLLVANYVKFDLKTAQLPGVTKYCSWKGLSVFCGPRGFASDTPILYHNEGNGQFRDVTPEALKGIEGLHYGLGVVSGDFDDDGWPDVYIACDSTPGILLHNNGDGTLTDVAVSAGVAYGPDGEELGSMGVVSADVDGDGRLDIVKTNFIEETPSLYKNLGGLFFADATAQSGLRSNWQTVGWGIVAADIDHDGRPDLLMANGHIYPELGNAYPQPKSLYWNGGGIFAAVSHAGWDTPRVSRGMAAGDLDGDGVLEFVVSNMNGSPSLYKNYAPKGHALVIRLEGTKSNRSAIGARVVLHAGGRKQTAEMQSGGSYASQNDFALHFGLGKAERADVIEVKWPSGSAERFTEVDAGQTVYIKEGAGITKHVAWRR